MNPIITTDAWSYKLFEQYLNTFFRELQVQLEQHILSEQDSPLTIHAPRTKGLKFNSVKSLWDAELN